MMDRFLAVSVCLLSCLDPGRHGARGDPATHPPATAAGVLSQLDALSARVELHAQRAEAAEAERRLAALDRMLLAERAWRRAGTRCERGAAKAAWIEARHELGGR